MSVFRMLIRSEDHPEQQDAAEPPPHRSLLLLARIVCILIDLLTLGLFVVTLPVYFAQLQTLCNKNTCITGQLSTNNGSILLRLGLSLNDYASLGVALVIVAVLPCVIIAGLLLWRKADNWTALLVAVMLVGLGTSYSLADASVLRPLLGPGLALLVSSMANYLGAMALPLIFALFPNGRFVPRWTRWLLLTMLLAGIVVTLPSSSTGAANTLDLLGSLIWGSCLLLLAGTQIYRYRRVSTLVEQQQTKLVLLGLALALLLTLGLSLPLLFFPFLRQADSPYYPIWTLLVSFILTLPIALGFGLAVLRYRLYNIDVIINRTLVYATLTATLALIYAILVFALQSLAYVLTRQASNPLIITASTLVIAVLFAPLRRYIQALIDRRFYRSKYNTQRTLAAFSTTLHSQLDLDQLSEQLVMVVQETMQPSYVSLWLRPPPAHSISVQDQANYPA